MAGFRIEGNTSGNVAEVDADHNLNVVTPLDPTLAGFVVLAAEADDGYVMGSRTIKALEATEDYRLRVGVDNILFSETFASTTLNTSIWTAATTTMTAVIVNGWMVLNSGSSAAATVDARLQTWRYFPVIGSFGTYIDMAIIISALSIFSC